MCVYQHVTSYHHTSHSLLWVTWLTRDRIHVLAVNVASSRMLLFTLQFWGTHNSSLLIFLGTDLANFQSDFQWKNGCCYHMISTWIILQQNHYYRSWCMCDSGLDKIAAVPPDFRTSYFLRALRLLPHIKHAKRDYNVLFWQPSFYFNINKAWYIP